MPVDEKHIDIDRVVQSRVRNGLNKVRVGPS